jgi:circadian clock protein KaiC
MMAADEAVHGSLELPVASQVDASGVANLDAVLGGGVPRGALASVAGPPSSGKTTLVCQIAFATGHRRRQTLIRTALSEPTNKLLIHLRSSHFIDETLLGGPVTLISLERFLP